MTPDELKSMKKDLLRYLRALDMNLTDWCVYEEKETLLAADMYAGKIHGLLSQLRMKRKV